MNEQQSEYIKIPKEIIPYLSFLTFGRGDHQETLNKISDDILTEENIKRNRGLILLSQVLLLEKLHKGRFLKCIDIKRDEKNYKDIELLVIKGDTNSRNRLVKFIYDILCCSINGLTFHEILIKIKRVTNYIGYSDDQFYNTCSAIMNEHKKGNNPLWYQDKRIYYPRMSLSYKS